MHVSDTYGIYHGKGSAAGESGRAEPLVEHPSALDLLRCGPGLDRPLTAASSPSCVARRTPGEACAGGELDCQQSSCAEGSLCRCNARECTNGTCVVRRDAGEVCGEANVVCIPGTQCRDARCVISGSQGLADGCPAE